MKIGIDMGGMSIKFGLVNEENKIVVKTTIPTDLSISYQELFKSMADAVNEILVMGNTTLDQCDGVGIGCPGTIDDQNGVIIYSNNFYWKDIPIINELKKYLNIKIRIANDADAAALGEVCAGAAKGQKDVVLLTLGTGVGGGVIIDRKIFHGSLIGGCELGHSVIQFDGIPCTCGRKGCLEAYASATGLIRMAREEAKKYPESIMNEMCGHDLSNMNGKIPFDAAEQGDEAGKSVVAQYEGYLACGIANVINTFQPEKVILGGGVAAQKDKLTNPLQEIVADMCFGGQHGEISQIVTSELGNDAGIIGAANLV